MTHCQIILLHHNYPLVYSVLDQFEQSIIDRIQNKNNINKKWYIIQSKRKLSTFIAKNSILSYDVSRVIIDFVNPSLKICESYFGNNDKTDISLSFYDHFVDFNHHSLVEFASKNFKNCKLSKTCFIQLFDEKEAKLLLLNNNKNDENDVKKDDEKSMSEVYGFLTRLYSSAFEKSHHIHLFAQHKRENVGINSVDKYKLSIKEEKVQNKLKINGVINGIFINGNYGINNYNVNGGNNQLLCNHHLTSFSSLKILSYLLSTIMSKNKEPPMSMYDICGSLSLISKIRLRLNVVKEIKSSIDPLYLSQNKSMIDLVDHIMKSPPKYQSYSRLRTSYNTVS